MKTLSISPHTAQVIITLEAAGFEAWCVGGCVRDSLLGREPADWDVATNARPEEILACFPNRPAVETGRRHGTIGIVTEGGLVEATTFRVDGDYAGFRRPVEVQFSQSLREDLSRRDFTVNAMAYHPDRGLQDPFGGQEDLKRRMLRCVGDPKSRFQEDALRILRCLRFAAVLGFGIQPETRRMALDCRGLIAALSGERVREELTKLLCGDWMRPVLEENALVLFAALPELEALSGCGQENPYHQYDCWEHTLHATEAVPAKPILRWAALLHDCGKPLVKTFDSQGTAHFYGHAEVGARLAGELLARLRFPRRELEAVVRLVEGHGEILPMGEKRVKRLLGALGEEDFWALLALVRGDISAQTAWVAAKRLPLVDQAEVLAEDILARGSCLAVKDLAVDGQDLMNLGYRPGPALGKSLKTLLEEVLSGELANEKPGLLARAGELLGDGARPM